jgi:outer membrane protein assembly factor BamA
MNRIFSSRVELNAKFPNQYEFLEPSVTLRYIEPWLGPLPVALRSNIIFEKKDDFDQDKLSGEFNSELQYQLTRHYGFKYLVYGISASKIFNQRLSDGSIDRVTEVSERTVVVGPGITVDYRNDPFNPSRGWIATTTMRFSDPFLGSDADIKFLHIFTTLRGYYPILSKLVFATYFGHGVEWARGDGHISTDYILKLGGRSSLRSYAHNSIGPTGTDFTYIRNSQSFNTRAELRWSVWEEFGLAFFWDGGTVLVNDGPVSGFRHSVGPGLRYKTPVGPIAFDVAFSVDNEPRPPGQNSDWRIFFSLGTF